MQVRVEIQQHVYIDINILAKATDNSTGAEAPASPNMLYYNAKMYFCTRMLRHSDANDLMLGLFLV